MSKSSKTIKKQKRAFPFEHLFIFIYLSLFSLVFPLYFVYPNPGYRTIQLFTSISIMSAIALGFIFFKIENFSYFFNRNRLLATAISVIFVISMIHFFIGTGWDFDDLSFSLIWITIPIFVYLYYKSMSRLFSYFILFLWVFDLLQSHFQTGEVVGIIGNRNWHATFLLAALIISIELFFRFIKSITVNKKAIKQSLQILVGIIFTLLTVYTFYIIYLCDSRAAWLGLVVIIFIFLLTHLGTYFLKISPKNKIISISTVAVLIIIGLFLTFQNKFIYDNVSKGQIQIVESLRSDVRGPLWSGCIDMIEAMPYIGSGTASFESEFAKYRPIEYFLTPLHAVRSNHPHNSLLYIGASYGIPGLIAWVILWIIPLLIGFFRYKMLSFFEKVILYAYLLLLFHSMLDLIFFEWPTIIIGGMLIGFLWYSYCKPTTNETEKILLTTPLKIFFFIVGIIIFLLSSLSIYKTTMSTYYFRKATIATDFKREDIALELYNKGLEYFKDPKYIYKAGINSLLKQNNPLLALHYFKMYQQTPLESYAHSNAFTAVCLLKLNKEKEALPYLYNETINYPMLTSSWLRLAQLQQKLGLTLDAEKSIENMKETMQLKGLSEKSLPYLSQNPEFDSYPARIPKNILDKIKLEPNK